MAHGIPCCFVLFPLVVVSLSNVFFPALGSEFISAVGDPGMKRDGLRLAIEAWNQCNEVGEEAPNMGSPRAADCFDVYRASSQQEGKFLFFFFLYFWFLWLSDFKR